MFSLLDVWDELESTRVQGHSFMSNGVLIQSLASLENYVSEINNGKYIIYFGYFEIRIMY
jgi:hypothetical protein